MQSFEVDLTEAEKAKALLISSENIDRCYKAKKIGDKIHFPILKKDENLLKNISGSRFGSAKFQKAKKSSDYRDELGFIDEKDRKPLPSSFDMIGDIVIIEIPEGLERYEKEIGKAILETHKNIVTVLKKAGQHEGEFRTQKLSLLAGEDKRETIYKENNSRIMLDVEEVYFSQRLSTERKRIYEQIKKGEDILVMFSGSGVYPIVISKNTDAGSIVGIEKNPIGHRYALKNIKLNKVKNVVFLQGDVREVIPTLDKKFDRILMPLPKGAEDFLDIAFSVSKDKTIIHFYDFEHESELEIGEKKVKEACKRNKKTCKILETVKCGQYSPGKFRICVDFIIY